MVKNEKNIFEKIRNFSALDERDCQTAWPFAHWGQFGRERALGRMGADPPHFHMHIGEIGQFFEVWVFRRTNAELCVDGPCKTAGHLQNTPGTPAMHFPLVVAGSQRAFRNFFLWSASPFARIPGDPCRRTKEEKGFGVFWFLLPTTTTYYYYCCCC